MKGLTHIGREDKIVLILLIYVVHAESFSRGVGEASDHIAADDLALPLFGVSLDFEWCFSGVLDPIVVVNALVGQLLAQRRWAQRTFGCWHGNKFCRVRDSQSWLLRCSTRSNSLLCSFGRLILFDMYLVEGLIEQNFLSFLLS